MSRQISAHAFADRSLLMHLLRTDFSAENVAAAGLGRARGALRPGRREPQGGRGPRKEAN